MKTIKWIIVGILLGTMASCGYSVQSESEAKNQKYRVQDLEERFTQVKLEMEAEKDSILVRLERSRHELAHYKDSVAFMELTRIMCYQNDMHRHSCEIYK